MPDWARKIAEYNEEFRMNENIRWRRVARTPYTRNQISKTYQAMSKDQREDVADTVDKLFAQRTGFKGKIDERNPAHQGLVRQWLTLRDVVILLKRAELDQKPEAKDKYRNKNAKLEAEFPVIRPHTLEAEFLAQKLPTEIQQPGDASGPDELQESNIPGIVDLAVTTAHELEGVDIGVPELLEVLEVGGGTATAIVATWTVLLAVGTFGAGLAEIVDAHKLGDRDAERYAYIHGFASHLVNGKITNVLPRESDLGRWQATGEKGAEIYLEKMEPAVRVEFLKLFRKHEEWAGQNMDYAVHKLGYDP